MRPSLAPRPDRQAIVRLLPLLLVIVSLACALPFSPRPTATPTLLPSLTPTVTPPPTATPQPLSPALVESDPPLTAELPLDGPITLYFNQAMDRASVEASLSTQMGTDLAFNWVDDSTLIVYMNQPLQPETAVSLNLSDAARSSQGKPLLQPVRLEYVTAGYLRLIQAAPSRGAAEVDPAAPVVAAFNRPVVPLGADPTGLPQGFSLEPAANGRGEWLNTSTYVFYPDPALAGGQTYTVQINRSLKSTDGGPLQGEEPWSFTTARPQLLSLSPVTETPWPLDPKITLTFNQPMDTASVESLFRMATADGRPVTGKTAWDDHDTVFSFTPDGLLERGMQYDVSLDGQARSAGGAPLGEGLGARVVTNAPLAITNVSPEAGSQIEPNGNLTLYFSAPLQEIQDAKDYLVFEPGVSNVYAYYTDEAHMQLAVSGSFAPRTAYTLRVSPNLSDPWGGRLGGEFSYSFTTGQLTPNLSVVTTGSAIFITTADSGLSVQAANLAEVPLNVGRIRLPDFFALNGSQSYEFSQRYSPDGQSSWVQPLSLTPDKMETTELYLSQDRSPLSPGIYHLSFNFPNDGRAGNAIYAGPYFVVVSDVQVELKAGATEALVWLVDLRTGAPLANASVGIYGEDGQPLAQGLTGADGVYRAQYAPLTDPYAAVYAVVAQPGDPQFGLTHTRWNIGTGAEDFGLSGASTLPGPKVYLYSDRPIYRPGQTVYFRAVVRQAFNGRYTAPEAASLPLSVNGVEGTPLMEMDLPLSGFGAAHGQYQIAPDAVPGSYAIISNLGQGAYLNFEVANYRKPEINLQVGFDRQQFQSGETLQASVEARYFFDAPAGNLKLHWALYATDERFTLPGYRVGLEDTSWMDAWGMPNFRDPLGALVSEDDARLDQDGRVRLEIPVKPVNERTQYTLEATLTDESGLPVSGRGRTLANPDRFYIGIRPDAWNGRANEPSGFEALVVDEQGRPLDGAALPGLLRADFKKVVWERIEPDVMFGMPEYKPQYTPIASSDFLPGPDGKARLAFTAPEAGTFLLDIYNPQGGGPDTGARTQALVWVSGPGEAVWPNLPNAHLQIIPNQEGYQPGETAAVFIPNPFGRAVPALITLERSLVFNYQSLTIPAEGYTLRLPLTAEHAPNIFVSVTLVGQNERGIADFRYGLADLEVAPIEQELMVTLLSEPQRAGPGDPVTLQLQVTDASGAPQQGEFSLAVVDLAALALAPANSQEILPAFYGPQPNGIRTGLSLAAYARRMMDLPGGMGGGGGAEAISVARENFPDTALWNAEIVTGPDGRAVVTLDLPDTLTTWQVEARGLTQDTRVGQGQAQIVTTKDLIVRPVTPRFFVAGDHATLAAVVQNNTGGELQVDVSLQAAGFVLDDPASAAQPVSVPANGRARVEWTGTVEEARLVELTFSASGGGLQDAARPSLGDLPVLRYTAPQTFRTSGILDEGGEINELISLPRSYKAQGGELQVELAPTLSGAMLQGLQALEASPYDSTEGLLSSFLPNLETYRTLQEQGIENPELKARLDRTLNSGLQRLLARQRPDGGFPWWEEQEGDPFVTSYVLFGLTRALQAGVSVNIEVIQRAITFLQGSGPTPPAGLAAAPGAAKLDLLMIERSGTAGAAGMLGGGGWPPQPYQWDRLAFREYVLALNNSADAAMVELILQNQAQLSPWARALLALTLEALSPGRAEAQALIDGLQTGALRSATGAFWEMAQDENGRQAMNANMQTQLSNTAIVLFALAQRDPASPLAADALRYLMASRDAQGSWPSSYTTAWTLMALNQVLSGTGELSGNFDFGALLNGSPVAQGQAGGGPTAAPALAEVPLQRLYPDYPNLLAIQRGGGSGRLYYAVGLNVARPVPDVAPSIHGIAIQRAVYPFGEACPKGDCEPISSAAAGQKVTVRLNLSVPQDLYFVAVSDYIPAGSEILDTRLLTSRQGEGGEAQTVQTADPRNPFARGWGWERFNPAQIFDDHITWTAAYVPAGAYQLTYTLVLLQPGQYQMLPALARQLYFPEVYGNSAGSLFEIRP
ncbi:MAG: Ig-like domain-containing protein [Chloroflexota bacterium]